MSFSQGRSQGGAQGAFAPPPFFPETKTAEAIAHVLKFQPHPPRHARVARMQGRQAPCQALLAIWESLFGGMERWNGMVEWNDGME